MTLDQDREQNNSLVKGVGDVIGLSGNSSAFHQWMVAGPEMAQMLTGFEQTFC